MPRFPHRLALAGALSAVAAFTGIAPPADAKSYLGCGQRSAWSTYIRPSKCYVGWPDLPNATAVYLQHIRWSSWGAPTAKGRALYRYRTNEPWTHVTVKAFRKDHCGGGDALYTRVRVFFPTYNRVWRTPRCSDLPTD